MCELKLMIIVLSSKGSQGDVLVQWIGDTFIPFVEMRAGGGIGEE
jgi:hypothetical protein